MATTSKYQSQHIRFKTPNIVIVFSNTLPNISQLSRDRWSVYNIKDNDIEVANIDIVDKKQKDERRKQLNTYKK